MTNISVQSDPPLSAKQTLPTMYDLPSENQEEPGLPDEFHYLQPELLRKTFQPHNWYPNLLFCGNDMNLYYDVKHPNWYKRPDWFGVVGVPRLYEERDMRLSYVVWQEGVNPLVVVELLSPGTEDEDLGQTVRNLGKPATKWEVYEQILRVPYYVTFSRYTNEMQGFHLVGDRYQTAELTNGRLLIPSIELSLGLWQGSYSNIERLWLRWMSMDGDLIPTPEEESVAAQQRAINAEERATNAEERADRLAAKLRELGIDADELS
ncbi:MAG: Uma2 family endonuclease [Okeania sp. SIO3B5]|uniref:Uma2 family endonuclease n=1 Tax=Okeania sp. SIO3B5 TaxID=2607811 RepID=UPI0013FE7290|nr:Uma2 family endonuclease [Okeania sp. SIO3B5]NEO56229.1 Uma2 family endonuclease [Okeania sp. SIO3B5]